MIAKKHFTLNTEQFKNFNFVFIRRKRKTYIKNKNKTFKKICKTRIFTAKIKKIAKCQKHTRIFFLNNFIHNIKSEILGDKFEHLIVV